MRRMRTSFRVLSRIALSAGLWWGVRAPARTPSIPEPPATLVIGEVFQFVEGAWAEYDMTDRTEDREFTLRLSILDGRTVRRWWSFWRARPHQWMEFAVTMPDQPRVVVKCLARITPDGPGALHEAIVQIDGIENPLRLKRRWLRRQDEPVARPDVDWVDHRIDESEMTHEGRTFSAWRVEAIDDEGRPLEAVISFDLPPIGLYRAETPDMRMQLRDWGTGAKSEITGQPLGLTRWVYRQVRQGGPAE